MRAGPSIRNAILAARIGVSACALACLATAFAPVAGQSNQPSREPILRIDTGTHNAKISRIGVDADNRFVVTGSEDKTIRVWELQTGRLLRVIRPPIGEGDEGSFPAVALSPDGRTIAASMYGPPGQPTLDFFDLPSGKLIRHMLDLKDIAHQLAYSPDGKYLAATLYTGELRLYETRNYTLAASDSDCTDESYGVTFDAIDRLVTTCNDGYLRMYGVTRDSSLQLMAKGKTPNGKHPYSVAISPNTMEVAAGYDDVARVDVFSGRDLSPLFSPNVSDLIGAALESVAWSSDGQTLYAGGRWWLNTADHIRAWSNGGRGPSRDIPAAPDTILHILPLRKGGIVYGSAAPAWGVIDANGVRTTYVPRSTADFRMSQKAFLLSADGSTVQFNYEFLANAPARFSLQDRRLDTAPTGMSGLYLPIDQGIAVTDWNSAYSPKLNGRPLPLQRAEFSRSLAIAPDRAHFLLGTEWHVMMFDANGTLVWSNPSPGAAFCVNVSADGNLAVAAFSDGTIRWFRAVDGKELLAFFPHADRKRWVLWTPSGYYDASPGGEDLIGWQVNNGYENAADFFPVAQFRSTYYRPDIVAKVLETQDEGKAILAANTVSGRRASETSVAKMLPPVVEVVSPADGADITSPSVTLKYSVRSPSGEPVTDVLVLVDGRPASTERGVSPMETPQTGSVLETHVSLPPRDTVVSIIAANRFAPSTPATVHLHWRGAAVADEFEVKPKLYVLAIGVSHYADPSLQLRFAAKDAQDFAFALQRQKGGLYRDVQVKLLTDEGANRDDVLDGLEWIRTQTTSKDVAMVLLSGHGVNDRSGQYFFLPHDADPEKLLRTGVSMADIRTTIDSLAGKTLFFVDTCHSGNVLGGRKGNEADINGLVNELASAENGAVVFAASTGTQYSIEDPAWKNGAFTKALVEGLDGAADYRRTGRITLNMLDLYISERVKELTRGQQTPTTKKPDMVSDFPVAVKDK